MKFFKFFNVLRKLKDFVNLTGDVCIPLRIYVILQWLNWIRFSLKSTMLNRNEIMWKGVK